MKDKHGFKVNRYKYRKYARYKYQDKEKVYKKTPPTKKNAVLLLNN